MLTDKGIVLATKLIMTILLVGLSFFGLFLLQRFGLLDGDWVIYAIGFTTGSFVRYVWSQD